ncbi:MAG: flippase-like domain-containing protein [Alphaproteobacteria bacterium]|nr:flippase-like domain-containing protein [Alphaproteobacteria bacterium]
MDIGAIQGRLAGISPVWLIAGAAVFLLQFFIGGVRWKVVTDAIGARLRLREAVKLFYIGTFFGQVLSVGGDAMRIYKAYRGGMTLPAAFNGVFLERAGTVLALLLLVAATQPVLIKHVPPEKAGVLLFTAGMTFAAGIGGLVLLALAHRLPDSLDRFKAIRAIHAVAADTKRVFFAPGPLARLLVWGVLTHANLTLAVFVLSLGLGIDIDLVDCLALVPPVILITTLPISIGGWGVRETAMIYALGLIGVAENDAGALSILVGLVGLAVSLPGGLVWLKDGDRRLVLDPEKPN